MSLPDKSLLYKGTSVKRTNVEIEYSPENVQEIMKCKKDPIYFVENYCKIVSLDKGLTSFDLYNCQKTAIKHMTKNRMSILMFPRQTGKTTTTAAVILYYILFNPNYQVAIVAHKASGAREVLTRIKLMYENLPLWLQHGVKTWNKGDIELENGSVVFTGATTISGLRGKSCNLLFCDEAAIIQNSVAEQFFTSTYPVISAGSDTKIILASTPLGYNHFWKFWNDALHGVNGFAPYRINYWDIPGRDEKWAEGQKKILGELKFNQEILCVAGPTTVTVRDKLTGKVMEISMEQLYEECV